jgi:hypothetical protein
MAGAMRLGHLLQSMESRLMTCEHRAAPPELFQALDTDLDFIGFMLEGLTAESDRLPRLAPKSPQETNAATEAKAPVEAKDFAPLPSPRLPAVEGPIIVPVSLEELIVLPSAEPELPIATQEETAAPVAVSGSRIESLKADLAAMAQRMKDLSAQLRELQAQTELSMRSRMTELTESGGECDSGELDSLARVQDLTDSLSEALTGLTVVQQSLLRHIDEADAALSERSLAPAT